MTTPDMIRDDCDARGPAPEEAGTDLVMVREIRWGDCDPAGIVYTPNILGYAVEAIEAWYARVLRTSWPAIMAERDMATPMVSAELAFKKPMRPGDRVGLRVRVSRLGRTSLTFAVAGEDAQGDTLFTAVLSSCFIDRKTFRPTPIPADLRARIEAWGRSCA